MALANSGERIAYSIGGDPSTELGVGVAAIRPQRIPGRNAARSAGRFRIDGRSLSARDAGAARYARSRRYVQPECGRSSRSPAVLDQFGHVRRALTVNLGHVRNRVLVEPEPCIDL